MDIDDIWEYTTDQWGIQQAEIYVGQIGLACRDIAAGTIQGRTAEGIRPGYRQQAVGSHVVFYQERSNAVLVIRILHQRMTAPKHIG